MVQIHFEADSHISEKDPQVIIKAASLGPEVQSLLKYLEGYSSRSPGIIPLKSEDRILMVKINSIILADINNNILMVHTLQGVIRTKETLTHFNQRIHNSHFIQVSKHAIINVDHLLSLSDSFSGNMSAKLTAKIKTDVSRKYVKTLMHFLKI